MPSRIPRTRNPETVWKIVVAQCNQLADAVKGQRMPFLLALSWTFLWGWSVYASHSGYLATFYRTRIAQSLSYEDLAKKTIASDQPKSLSSDDKKKSDQFWNDCNRVTAIELDPNPKRLKDCSEALKRRQNWAEKAYLDSTALSFPGGFAKIENSDLGVVGQVGLLLILAWLFYATRRENHSIRAFVEMDEAARRLGYLFPTKFVLVPQDENHYLSAEHLTYAYYAVAHQFVFILSRYSRPLLRMSIVLHSLPGVVASVHVMTDAQSFLHYVWEPNLIIRFSIEVLLLCLVWYITANIVRYVVDTGTILNGWYLASTKIWMKEWSGTSGVPASRVEVDVLHQTVRIHRDD